MPRVHYVKKARKDNSVCKRGESYYWWKFPYRAKLLSLKKPKPSQLTQSGKLSQLYSIAEGLDELGQDDEPDSIAEQIRTAASEVEEVRDEYQESFDNMTDAFPNGCPTMEEIESKVEELDGWIDELEGHASEFDSHSRSDFDKGKLGQDDCDEVNEIGDADFQERTNDLLCDMPACPL